MNDLPPPPLPPRQDSELDITQDPFEAFDKHLKPTGYLDALLKTPNRLTSDIQERNAVSALYALGTLAIGGLLCYGFITGLFSGGMQLLWSPLKVLAVVLGSSLLCLPSLYIFVALAGIEVKPIQLIAHGSAGLALSSILLVGLAPVLFLFSVSTESLVFMGVLHLLLWSVAGSAGAQRFLKALGYLRSKNSGYPVLWLWIFTLVLLQMSTTLRPILGSSEDLFSSEKQFFILHWLDVLN
jgi:hypothetical protein